METQSQLHNGGNGNGKATATMAPKPLSEPIGRTDRQNVRSYSSFLFRIALIVGFIWMAQRFIFND